MFRKMHRKLFQVKAIGHTVISTLCHAGLRSFLPLWWIVFETRVCKFKTLPTEYVWMWVEASWNVKAYAQKPDVVFLRNGRVHLNRRGASVQSTTGNRGVRISGSNAGYTMFWGSVKGTAYPLHSPVSPSLPLTCVTVCHHVSTGIYHRSLEHWDGVVWNF